MSIGLPQSAAFYERLAYHADLPFVSLQPDDGVDPVNPLAAQTRAGAGRAPVRRAPDLADGADADGRQQ